MKRKIFIVLLAVMIIGETIFLYNQNIGLKEKNKNINKEFEENNLIIDNKVNLESIIAERDNLKIETNEVFKEENIEDTFNKANMEKKNLNEEIAKLEKQIIELEGNLSTLQNKYNKLLKEYEEKNTFYITNVPFINQYPNYPTGCESVALTILLNYYGVVVTPDDIIAALPKGSLPYTKNGKVYGGNPEVEFIGNPYSLNSYGVYEKPIAEVANKFKNGITVATGTDFDTILKIVSSGKPVIAWTSMSLATPYVSRSWIYEPTGETIYWKANEHAVVIIGYTPSKVIISDPIGGKVKYQSRSIFKERYNYYGKKALYY
ncbi:MAG: C39 family peptidase [Bacilli bacterium]|nr:C39 family peptidase [Bacilli bacterium]